MRYALLLLLLCGCATQAVEEGPYGEAGLGYSHQRFNAERAQDGGVTVLRGGYRVSPAAAVELEYGRANYRVDGDVTELSSFGVGARFFSEFGPYMVLGARNGVIRFEEEGSPLHKSDVIGSVGVGWEIDISEYAYLRPEVRYSSALGDWKDDDVDTVEVLLSLGLRF